MQDIEYTTGQLRPTETVSQAWGAAGQNYWMLFGVFIVGWLIQAAAGCIPFGAFFIAGPISVGIYSCYLSEMNGEPWEFGKMFDGFKKFVPSMVVGLIYSIPSIMIQVGQWVLNFADLASILRRGNGDHFQARPGVDDILRNLPTFVYVLMAIFLVLSILIGITLAFVYQLMAEHDLSVGETISLSASAAWSNVGGLIVLFILETFLTLLGVLALCIGIFFMMPIVIMANAFAYRQVFPRIEKISNDMPPSPTSYQDGMFGTAQ